MLVLEFRCWINLTPLRSCFNKFSRYRTQEGVNSKRCRGGRLLTFFEEQGQNSQPFQNGFGLQTIYEVAKPIYRAYQLLAEFAGDTSIYTTVTDPQAPNNSTVMAFATMMKDGGGSLSVFLSNFNVYGQGVSDASVTVTINGGLQFDVMAPVYRIDSENANSEAAWISMGSPEYPTSQQIELLQAASQLSPQWVPVVSNTVQVDVPALGVAVVVLNLAA